VTEEANALLEAARDARIASDFMLLERISRELIVLGASSESPEAEAFGLYHLGIALSNLNHGTEAATATRRAIHLYEAAGDRFSAAKAMMNLGSIELDNEGNAGEARRLYEASEPVVREFGDPLNLAIALGNLGEICRLEGDYRRALGNAEESLSLFRTLDDTDNIVWQLTAIAHYRFALRQPEAAIEAMDAAHALLFVDPNPRWMAWYFDTWFVIAAGLNRWDEAAELLAFTDKYRDEQNQPRLQAMLPWISTPKERLARQMSHERQDELIAAGEALTIETAQRLTESIRPANS
jgi:tetratricopeptide (TPR) repeat protein